ncbi:MULTISPECIES: glycerophosphoryl diester phosphodiesterase membrane domain-containing protein [unclassified Mesorhizobium]|uniref:glycerophosphoryl diester phosphodiesterase membrane domain-containing protein n=1 Tax=unclassified Mesorhizobium TaxID=325217 RepID=UPI000BAF9983|nr:MULTISPECIES: glycerophosphoryl diester phosphodiesterase membrane domain-containing protein [unclassified Mesorhizobium]TGT60233.1 hypothetical protein EN813_027195 [Mesorhizobium sp. M00.F.Ca.ET.170.01.1.1]AZO08398.1 hypothetical protein EJ074_04100 [Mesorhizobium sp. M3A.F.Ca.ET.080.04.2.1]PBB84686.1 hypothetical protein CK216_22515 [Mesorhizobium sp. WSM3876]RWB72184.1 MAG: hypothetical protein EOQ49_13175 [Mesorhizobium sp.]RWB89414.1 MAG: hypothetical protein EOQ52_13755 [Mesorhizobiu
MVSTALSAPDRFRIGRVFHDSFAVIGRNPVLCVGLGVAFYALPRFAAWLWYVNSGAARLPAQELFSQHAILVVLGVPVYFVVTAILQASLMRATIVDLRGEKPIFSDCFGIALALLFPILGLSLLATLGIMVGLVLLIVPGILLVLRWAVAMPVLIQEGCGILDSMARSRDLTKGSRWRLLGLWLILTVASALASLVVNRFAIPLNVTFGLLAEATVRTAVLVLSSVASAVSYVELRRVKEGASVDELAQIFS